MFRMKMAVFYPHPPEKVWNAIALKQALAQWLMENDFEPRVGHKFCFHSQGVNDVIHAQVLEVDPPRRLSFSWRDNLMEYPSIVTWTLTPVANGTQLQLEHRGIKHETFKMAEPMRSQNQIHQPSSITQMVTGRSTLLQSSAQAYVAQNSIILSSYLNGGWNYKLNEILPQLLAEVASDKQ